jgi:hypothetical protein
MTRLLGAVMMAVVSAKSLDAKVVLFVLAVVP